VKASAALGQHGRVPAATLVAWPVLVVVAVDPAGWYPFGPLRWCVVSVGVLALFALVLRRPLRIVPPIQWLSLATIVTIGVAALVNGATRSSWFGTDDRHLGLVFWCLAATALLAGQSLVRRDASSSGALVEHFVSGLVAAGFVVGTTATAEALGWEPSVLAVDDRLSGLFGSPAYLGAASVLLLPVALGVALDRASARWRRALAAAATVTLVVALVGSGARAAWFGAALTMVLVAALHGRLGVARVRRHPVVGAALVAGLIAAMAVTVVVTPVGPRIGGLFDRDAPGGAARGDEWRVAVTVIGQHPLTGVGPEGYRLVVADGLDDAYVQRHGRDVAVDRAHSGPLDVALAGGLPALACWLALVVLVGRHLVRALRAGPMWLAGLAAGVVAYVFGQLALFPLAELDPLAWLMAGVGVGATARPGEVRERLAPAVASWAVAACAAVALIGGALDVAADRRAADAVAARRDGDTTIAVALVDDAIALRPDGARLRLLRADLAVAAGLGNDEGLRSIGDALAIEPTDPILRRRQAELAVARAEATQVPGHLDAARVLVADLIDRDGRDPGVWLLSARVAVLDDRRDDAVAAVQRGLELAPADPALLDARRRLDDRP
jgi:O-antigen ligase